MPRWLNFTEKVFKVKTVKRVLKYEWDAITALMGESPAACGEVISVVSRCHVADGGMIHFSQFKVGTTS
jgi:ABC-type enterochelin transport system ATPase subunit